MTETWRQTEIFGGSLSSFSRRFRQILGPPEVRDRDESFGHSTTLFWVVWSTHLRNVTTDLIQQPRIISWYLHVNMSTIMYNVSHISPARNALQLNNCGIQNWIYRRSSAVRQSGCRTTVINSLLYYNFHFSPQKYDDLLTNPQETRHKATQNHIHNFRHRIVLKAWVGIFESIGFSLMRYLYSNHSTGDGKLWPMADADSGVFKAWPKIFWKTDNDMIVCIRDNNKGLRPATFSFILIHLHSFLFILIHLHSFSFIFIYSLSSPFILIHSLSSSFIFICPHPSSSILIHLYSSSLIFIRLDSFSLIHPSSAGRSLRCWSDETPDNAFGQNGRREHSIDPPLWQE